MLGVLRLFVFRNTSFLCSIFDFDEDRKEKTPSLDSQPATGLHGMRDASDCQRTVEGKSEVRVEVSLPIVMAAAAEDPSDWRTQSSGPEGAVLGPSRCRLHVDTLCEPVQEKIENLTSSLMKNFNFCSAFDRMNKYVHMQAKKVYELFEKFEKKCVALKMFWTISRQT